MYVLLFALAAGLNILIGAKDWPSVLAGHLQDPDSYMRLLRLEEGVRAGHLVLSVAGDQSGAGVMVEWSRLYDIFLWLLAAPLAPLLGWHEAIFWAGAASGPITVGILGASLTWAAEPLALRRHLWSAALAAAVLPGLMTIALPGVVHYHIALLALTALTLGGVLRAWRDSRWAGFVAGLCGGLAIWLTPETMPFVLAGFLPLLVRLLDADNTTVIAATAAGFLDVIGFGMIFDPPQGGFWYPEIDRLSVVYLALALLLILAALVLMRFAGRLGARRGITGWGLMVGVMVVWVAAFPKVAMGPYGVLPAEQMHAFFGVMTELQPLTARDCVVMLTPGALAVIYLLWRAAGVPLQRARPDFLGTQDFLASRAAHRARVLWLYAAFIAAVALVLGAKFLLFVGFSAGLAAALLPVVLSELDARLGGQNLLAMAARLAVLALVLLAPDAASLAPSAPAAVAGGSKGFPSCSLAGTAALLAPAAHQVVLAPPEDTPELLYRTQVETVGGLYQHGVPGYMRARAAWRAAPGAAVPPDLRAAKVGWVLFCPQPGRYSLVAAAPPGSTLWDALEASLPPAWLTLAGQDAEGWRLYKVSP